MTSCRLSKREGRGGNDERLVASEHGVAWPWPLADLARGGGWARRPRGPCFD